MIYKEEHRDLFSVPEDYYLAHCISADFALGAGIAVEFSNRFNMKRLLKEQHPDYLKYYKKDKDVIGDCLLIGRVFNLVTKERYYEKPTYDSVEQALVEMRYCIQKLNIKKLAIPILGCGLDRLQWCKVSELIKKIFVGEDLEILVCKQ